MNTRLQQKILTNIHMPDDSSCWLWTGQVSNSGYGKIMVQDGDHGTRMESADQASYQAFIGTIPPGMLTRHRCNQRLCVNPEHLELFDPEAWRSQYKST